MDKTTLICYIFLMLNPRRVLIVSRHPLYAQGLRRLLQQRQQADVSVVAVVTGFDEALRAIEQHAIDLIVVDYDDQTINREDFLAHFVEGDSKLRVVLLSLKEDGDRAIVYDRRNFAAAQIDTWLNEWAEQPSQISAKKNNIPFWRTIDMKHWIGVILFIAVLTASGVMLLNNERLLTPAASLQAVPIDRLFSYHWTLISFLFALVAGFVLYSIIFFRRKPGDETDAPHIEGNNALEVTWTILPLITVIGFAVIGADALAEVTRVDPQALEIKVTGQQWSWRFEYPEYGIISDVLYLPKDRQALLVLESVDVLHSFWVPEFRVKQDLMPGSETELRITPNREGAFKIMCAEICGNKHTSMLADVQVMSQTAFDQWVSANRVASDDPVARGQQSYTTYGCNACHSLDGNPGVGPSFKGIYGKEHTFEDGTTAVADEAYLYESIVNPTAKIVKGFAPAMPPTFGQTLTEEQINDLIAFIKAQK